MKRRLVALAVVGCLLVGIAAPVAGADPNCTGPLSDRPASCFNAGPGQPGFHGP